MTPSRDTHHCLGYVDEVSIYEEEVPESPPELWLPLVYTLEFFAMISTIVGRIVSTSIARTN